MKNTVLEARNTNEFLDKNVIKNAFLDKSNTEKLAPTESFLNVAYEVLRSEFFGNKIPRSYNLKLKVRVAPRAAWVGTAGYIIYRDYSNPSIEAKSITLNSSRTLSLHEWLEVILHEMIHIYDYINNPRHFIDARRSKYDPHGTWFLDFGRQFDKHGFNVQKFCNADIGMNSDDDKVQSSIAKTVVMVLDGAQTVDPSRGKMAIVVSSSLLSKTFNYIVDKCNRGVIKGTKEIIFLSSKNPNIVRLKKLRMRSMYSSFSYFYYNDDFINKYGPFEEESKFAMTKQESIKLSEDKDEDDYDLMHHNDDSYAKEIYKNIKNVVDVKKIDDDEYEVTIE